MRITMKNMLTKNKLIISTVFAIIALLITLLTYRSSIYPYEVNRSYLYDFHQTDASITNLNLINGKVVLDKLDNTNQTAFLKVNINTTFAGRYLQPSIKIIAGNSFFTEYIEHGSKGFRYVNISSSISKGDTEIKLEGKYISIDDQRVQLVRFNNPDIQKAKILILAPHPDDAEIAAFGLYSDNINSYIMTVTAGDAGGYKYDEIYPDKAQHYLKKGFLRTWNSITVPLLGNIPPEQSVNFGFFDGTLATMFNNKSKPVSGIYTQTLDINTYRKQNVSSLSDGLSGDSSWRSLVENISYLLNEIKPDIIVAPYPALEGNDDHKFSSVALFEAMRETGMQNGILYLYSNHFVLNKRYPHGHSGGTISLPPNFNEAIYFDSIYSHPLSIDKQTDKVFALEAMNDLRLDTEWRSLRGTIKIAARKGKAIIGGHEYSYFERAIRSNELFFVIDMSNIYDEQKLNKIMGIL